MVYDPNGAGSRWVVVVEGMYANKYTKTITLEGGTETAFQYAIFDAQDLSEFVRGADQTIYGKIHANGNLFFRPSGTILTIRSESITAGGR